MSIFNWFRNRSRKRFAKDGRVNSNKNSGQSIDFINPVSPWSPSHSNNQTSDNHDVNGSSADDSFSRESSLGAAGETIGSDLGNIDTGFVDDSTVDSFSFDGGGDGGGGGGDF